MIENFNDLLSAILLVAIPLVILIIIMRFAFGGTRVVTPEEKKEIEYYREW